MTWFKVDDKLTSHPKFIGLTLEAKSLWFCAGVWCAQHNTDGMIPPDALPLIAFTASVPADKLDATTAGLVASKLWRKRPKRDGAGFEIANWLEYQPSRQQVQKRAEEADERDRMRDLHNWLHRRAVGRRVKEQVIERDQGRCRYCDVVVQLSAGDRRSPHRLTFDLVDPHEPFAWDLDQRAATQDELDELADRWVVACGWCNAVKQKRTPDEARMTLTAKTPGQARQVSKSNLITTGSGAGRDIGSDLVGSDQVGAGLNDPARHDAAPVEPDRVPPPTDDDLCQWGVS